MKILRNVSILVGALALAGCFAPVDDDPESSDSALVDGAGDGTSQARWQGNSEGEVRRATTTDVARDADTAHGASQN